MPSDGESLSQRLEEIEITEKTLIHLEIDKEFRWNWMGMVLAPFHFIDSIFDRLEVLVEEFLAPEGENSKL